MDKKELRKEDLELVLKVNEKAIEVQTEISDQFEEIINYGEDNNGLLKEILAENKRFKEDLDKLHKDMKEMKDTQFKIYLLLATGIVSLIIQVISILHK